MSAPDLSTTWLGLKLPNPFVCGASPLARDLDMVRRLVDSGVAAIVMPSLFEEAVLREERGALRHHEMHGDAFAEASSYQPMRDDLSFGPEDQLEALAAVKQAVTVPVVASLNGTSPGGWLRYAKQLQEAGADALELNVYELTIDPNETGVMVQGRTLSMIEEVRSSLSIPLSVKLSPFYSSLPNFAAQLEEAGVDGLVIFNRFFLPDIDPEELEVTRTLVPSSSTELLLRLRWLAVLSTQRKLSLAITGGVHRVIDAVKAVMCGAHAIQMVSSLLAGGPEHIITMRRGLSRWLEEHEYASLNSMRGCMNLKRCPDPSAYQRANYLEVLSSWHGTMPGPLSS